MVKSLKFYIHIGVILRSYIHINLVFTNGVIMSHLQTYTGHKLFSTLLENASKVNFVLYFYNLQLAILLLEKLFFCVSILTLNEQIMYNPSKRKKKIPVDSNTN